MATEKKITIHPVKDGNIDYTTNLFPNTKSDIVEYITTFGTTSITTVYEALNNLKGIYGDYTFVGKKTFTTKQNGNKADPQLFLTCATTGSGGSSDPIAVWGESANWFSPGKQLCIDSSFYSAGDANFAGYLHISGSSTTSTGAVAQIDGNTQISSGTLSILSGNISDGNTTIKINNIATLSILDTRVPKDLSSMSIIDVKSSTESVQSNMSIYIDNNGVPGKVSVNNLDYSKIIVSENDNLDNIRINDFIFKKEV